MSLKSGAGRKIILKMPTNKLRRPHSSAQFVRMRQWRSFAGVSRQCESWGFICVFNLCQGGICDAPRANWPSMRDSCFAAHPSMAIIQPLFGLKLGEPECMEFGRYVRHPSRCSSSCASPVLQRVFKFLHLNENVAQAIMRFLSARRPGVWFQILLVSFCVLVQSPHGNAGIHWPPPRKERLRLRLIAMAESDARSSFFSTHEIFLAAQQLTDNESRLVKVEYAFLPYQPRLSEYAFDYSFVYEVNATRDPACDQTLAQIITDQRDHSRVQLKYATDSPVLDTSRRHSPLPCYASAPEDFTKVFHQPASPEMEY